MTEYKDKLKYLTEKLLKNDLSYGQIKDTTDELYTLFLKASCVDDDSTGMGNAVYLSGGKAIDTYEAGMCVKEFMRTKQFISGIHEGILELKKRFPDSVLNVLYAGSGPFGALLLPLTTLFSPMDIKVTFLEINKTSVECLKRTITSFEAWGFVDDIVIADASEYKINRDKTFHMLVTETMQRALKKEPHVSIVLNLVDQIAEDGIMIPECIEIDAVLFDEKRNHQRMFGIDGADKDYFFMLGRVMELNLKTARRHSVKYKESANGQCVIDCPMFKLPNPMDLRFKRINLMTSITIFGGFKLSYFDCSLNLPYEIIDLSKMEGLPKYLTLSYVISSDPRFVVA